MGGKRHGLAVKRQFQGAGRRDPAKPAALGRFSGQGEQVSGGERRRQGDAGASEDGRAEQRGSQTSGAKGRQPAAAAHADPNSLRVAISGLT